MRRVSIWTGAVLGVLVLLLALTVALFDWNRLKPYVAGQAFHATGRDFAIEGDIDVDFGRVTVIRAAGIRLANADWGSAPEMARIEELFVSIRLWPLLRGRVELPEVRLLRPNLLLEKDARGERNNWDFSDSPAARAAAEAALPDDRFEFPLIGQLVIEDGSLTYLEPSRGIDVETEVTTAVGATGAPHEMVELTGRGQFQDEPFRLAIRAGSLLTLRETAEPYPLTLEMDVGQTRARVEGSMQDPVELAGVDLALTLAGPDPARLFPILGLPVPSLPPYQVSGRLLREGQVWRFTDFAGEVGGSDLRGEIAIDPSGDRPLVRADLLSRRLDFADLGGLVGAPPQEAEAAASPEQRALAEQAEKSPGVLPDAPLDMERVRAVDADLRFRGTQVLAPGVPLEAVDFHLLLQDGRLTFQPLNFRMGNGEVTSTIVIDGRRDRVATELDLQVLQVDLARLLEATPFAGETRGQVAGRAKLSGNGDTVLETLSTANGSLVLLMGDGLFSNLLMEVIGIDLAESLGFLVAGDESVEVRCMVADLAVRDGIVSPNVLVLDTADTKVVGKGSIDLGQETMDLRLEAEPKDASLLSAKAPVLIQGTFADPQIYPDPAALAARGGAAAALGALLTPLAALIPFIELGLGEDSDCHGMIRAAEKGGGAPAAEGSQPQR